MRTRSILLLLAAALGWTTASKAQHTPTRASDDDAVAAAAHLGISPEAAAHHLRRQHASVPVTDAVVARFAARLAGMSVVHAPHFQILVRLTGDSAVPPEQFEVDGEQIEVRYVPGAPASHTALVQAIANYQPAIRASLIVPPALGVDQRSGELVAVVSGRDVAREGADTLRSRLATLTRVPVRLRVVDDPSRDMGDDSGIAGGMRMLGERPDDPRRYLCTSGFVVTDGTRTGLATAAHCADTLRVRDAGGREAVLPLAGQWGWGYHDVQVNLSAVPLAPTFFADTDMTVRRVVTGAQSRASVRAGDVVCHRGERTGYSCGVVELTDFAPAGDLCGGACLPTWTTVSGPGCKGGDSGAPVFLGTTAYGILKGGSYRSDGSCAFYFYMSTDYLPTGWRLLTAADAVPASVAPTVQFGRSGG